MSRETLDYLRNNTLIGLTERRGFAWHARAGESLENNPNHYPGFVPVQHVADKLFGWEPTKLPMSAVLPDGTVITDESRAVIVHPDTHKILGAHREGYAIHGYKEWLLDGLSAIIGDTLGIGSAGLLRGGAVAWVQVDASDVLTVETGGAPVKVLPQILATTSLDGSCATINKFTYTDVVCDNTRDAALSGDGATFRTRHTRHSELKITDAREALGIMSRETDALDTMIRELTDREVSDSQFKIIVEEWAGLPAAQDKYAAAVRVQGEDKARKTGVTRAEGKVADVRGLYKGDPRVAPWAGTVWGVAQALNTYELHEASLRETTDRAERNLTELIKGVSGKRDASNLDLIARVLADA